jgi:arylsulfatase A-like enzyme
LEWELWAYKKGKIYPRDQLKFIGRHVYTTIPKMKRGDRLAERLQEVGYYTVAVPYAGHNAFFREGVGFEVGFDHFVDLSHKRLRSKSSRFVVKEVKKALDTAQAVRAKRPLFLWVHLYDPHESKKRRRRYHKLIRYTDKYVYRLLKELKRRRLSKNSLIMVISDHGESFGEHRYHGHATSMYEEQIKIPFFMKLPDSMKVKSKVIHTPVSQVDVTSTLLVAGGASTKDLDGVNLIELITQKNLKSNRPIFSELHRYFSSKGKRMKDIEVIIHRGFKLMRDRLRKTSRLYHLKTDPKEKKDRYTIDTQEVKELELLLKTFRRQGYPLPK